MKERIKLLLYLWTVGIFGGVLFWILRVTRRVQVKGYKNSKFDSKGRGMLLISNHPSPAEPMFLPFLFFPRYLVSLRFTPYSLPDKKHYDRREFIPMRKVCIPVDRRNGREELKTFKEMEEILNNGKILILHPEKEHTPEERTEDYLFSKSDKSINKFRPGIRKLFSRTNCLVLPVWIDGGPGVIPNNKKYSLPSSIFQFPRLWRKITIKIGEPLEPANFSNNEVVEHLENILLELADKEM
jgi:1-acyl-sn-glycerol-3-phosphate acyltransferase